MAKKSFILYCDSSDVVKKLSKEQAGELMFILFDYANGEKIPPIKDIAIDIVFTQIKNQFDRDLEKYNAVVLKRKEAGLLSGKARRTKRTSVKSVEQKATKRTDSVSDNDSVNVNDNNKIVLSKPTLFKDSVYFDKVKFKKVMPEDWNKEKLLYYYESALAWSGEGKKKIDWVATIKTWARKDEKEGKLKFSNNSYVPLQYHL